jgi:hypothetical protein
MDIQAIAADAGISVDEVRERWLSLRVALWKSDFRKFAKEAIRIRTKAGDLEPLRIERGAGHFAQRGRKAACRRAMGAPYAGLKGRRQGFSTYVAARGYWRATLWDRQRISTFSRTKWRRRIRFST